MFLFLRSSCLISRWLKKKNCWAQTEVRKPVRQLSFAGSELASRPEPGQSIGRTQFGFVWVSVPRRTHLLVALWTGLRSHFDLLCFVCRHGDFPADVRAVCVRLARTDDGFLLQRALIHAWRGLEPVGPQQNHRSPLRAEFRVWEPHMRRLSMVLRSRCRRKFLKMELCEMSRTRQMILNTHQSRTHNMFGWCGDLCWFCFQ